MTETEATPRRPHPAAEGRAFSGFAWIQLLLCLGCPTAATGGVPPPERDGATPPGKPGEGEAEIAALIEELKSPDAQTRERACWVIAQDLRRRGVYIDESPLRPQLAALLTEAVTGPDPRVRLAAAAALIRTVGEAERIVPVLIEWLEKGKAKERMGAAWLLALLGVEANAAAGVLEKALEDDLSVRVVAAYALYRQRWPADKLVPVIVEALREGDALSRLWAAEFLWCIGPDAAEAGPVLVERLAGDENQGVRCQAAQALPSVHVGPAQAIPALARALGDRDRFVREASADSLGEYGRHARAAVPALATALRDRSHYVRSRAAPALGRIGPDAAAAIPELLVAARSTGDPVLRARAIRALGAIAPRRKTVLAALVEALEYETWAAGEALGKAGLSAVPALVEALPRHRSAVIALGDIGAHAKAAVPALLGLLPTKEGYERREVIEALGKIGPAAMEAVPVLAKMAKRKEWETRLNAAVALAKITDGARGLDVLIADLSNAGDGIVIQAIGGLSDCGSLASPAVLPLARILAHENDVVRRYAAGALGVIGPAAKSASPALTKLMNGDDPVLGAEAAEALVRIGEAQVGLGHLIGRLRDRDQVSRMCAGRSLHSLGALAAPALRELRRATNDRFYWVNFEILRARGVIERELQRETAENHNGD